MNGPNTMTTLLASAAAAIPFAATSAQLAARSIESFWNDPTGGDFHEPANWLGPVPDETVTAIFDLDADYVVSFLVGDATSDRLVIRDGHVEMWLLEFDGLEVIGISYDRDAETARKAFAERDLSRRLVHVPQDEETVRLCGRGRPV